MYGYDERKKDTLDDDIDAVVIYLSHNNKKEHVDAVMRLVRRSASLQEQITKQRHELNAMDMVQDNTRYENRSGRNPGPEQLMLPPGTRKVNIEF